MPEATLTCLRTAAPRFSAAASSCIAGMACEEVSSVIETVAYPKR